MTSRKLNVLDCDNSWIAADLQFIMSILKSVSIIWRVLKDYDFFIYVVFIK